MNPSKVVNFKLLVILPDSLPLNSWTPLFERAPKCPFTIKHELQTALKISRPFLVAKLLLSIIQSVLRTCKKALKANLFHVRQSRTNQIPLKQVQRDFLIRIIYLFHSNILFNHFIHIVLVSSRRCRIVFAAVCFVVRKYADSQERNIIRFRNLCS